MAIQLPDARHLSDEALQILRLRALRGIELGYNGAALHAPGPLMLAATAFRGVSASSP